MPVEFVGMIFHRDESEVSAGRYEGDVDPEFVKTFARAHEAGGFDSALIGYGSSGPDGWSLATWAAAATERLRFLVAHRPGFVVPTLAARKAATIDQLTGGRLSLHIVTGGSDQEQARDGDFLDKDARYRRTDEYLDVLRKTWTSSQPFDHEGEFYRFQGAFSGVKPLQKPHIPIYFGGSSEAALRVGARQADVWATWGEPVEAVRSQIESVRSAAAALGRELRFSVSVRPILGSTEAKAWQRAHEILERETTKAAKKPPRNPRNAGSLRLLDFAQQGDVLDKRLFTAIARATGADGNSTALVGTPEQVAESLLDYYDAGATTLLIRGFDPLQDAIDYGRDLLPLVHAEVARRDHSREGHPPKRETIVI
ncbi:MAG TPA: LLM class flavin-dependent oxidoreductase [Dehalococcoidia bacterium]|nr:LLM class flavin-dependent oxidoreductase [Dehalococcoidia bacterium]